MKWNTKNFSFLSGLLLYAVCCVLGRCPEKIRQKFDTVFRMRACVSMPMPLSNIDRLSSCYLAVFHLQFIKINSYRYVFFCVGFCCCFFLGSTKQNRQHNRRTDQNGIQNEITRKITSLFFLRRAFVILCDTTAATTMTTTTTTALLNDEKRRKKHNGHTRFGYEIRVSKMIAYAWNCKG